ncbi:MAG: tetratricopeptide repeat protein [Candidatus Schekmanbacteria bacterium]|nr:tetratricopeptide repeat protein [Candidatus Schekmanbacteria bacterium]
MHVAGIALCAVVMLVTLPVAVGAQERAPLVSSAELSGPLPLLPGALRVPIDLQVHLHAGRNALLGRRYGDALEIFMALERRYPKSPIGPLGRMLLYETQMLENLDFDQSEAFVAAADEARKRAEAALTQSGAEPWGLFLKGAIFGIDGLHSMRCERYWHALGAGLKAMSAIKASRELASDFTDLHMGLGVYVYFRSMVTRKLPWLPFFPDRREEGIAEIETSRHGSVYTPYISEVILTFVYGHEQRSDDCLRTGAEVLARFPKNILVRLLMGRALGDSGRYLTALELFDEVLAIDATNRPAMFFAGRFRLAAGIELDRARAYLEGFVARPPTARWRGWGNLRLGDVHERLGDLSRAVQCWKLAAQDIPAEPEVKRRLATAEHLAEWASRRPPTSPPPTGGGR